MSFYSEVNIGRVKEAGAAMGLDMTREVEENFGLPYSDDENYKECLCHCFLNDVFVLNGERDPLECRHFFGTTNIIPESVKRVYRELTLIEAKAIRWE